VRKVRSSSPAKSPSARQSGRMTGAVAPTAGTVIGRRRRRRHVRAPLTSYERRARPSGRDA
jgi:hypothetical protein